MPFFYTFYFCFLTFQNKFDLFEFYAKYDCLSFYFINSLLFMILVDSDSKKTLNENFNAYFFINPALQGL